MRVPLKAAGWPVQNEQGPGAASIQQMTVVQKLGKFSKFSHWLNRKVEWSLILPFTHRGGLWD